MIRHAIFFALTVGAPGLALADASADSPGLFRDAHFTYARDPAPMRAAAHELAKACAMTSPHSRIGPRPSDPIGCDKAITTLAAGGSDGARAMLEAVDDQGAADARYRMYDLVGRSGDPSLIEPLVAALGKLDGRHLAERKFETGSIVAALQALSFATVGKSSPFGRWSEPQPHPMAVAWRGWLGAHHGRTRAELLAERVAQSQAQAADRDPGVAFEAAQFLVGQQPTHDEGLSALRKLAARDGLSKYQRQLIDAAASTQPGPAPNVGEGRV